MTVGDAADGAELMARALRELRRAQQRIDELEARQHEPIAIVGAGCRLPGAESPTALWQLLAAGVDATGPIPTGRWDVGRFHHPEPGRRGRIAPSRGAFLDRVDGFDAALFGIAPAEVVLMDPQQRLLLEVAWHALEDAGLAADALRGTAVGVFVGISTTDYAYHLVQRVPPDEVTAHCGTGTAHSVAAGRLAYCFDLRGPCLAIDTACSSSLLALHLACQSLRQGECELALVAGVNAMVSPLTPISFSHAGMLAPDGRCKTFAASADGYARGEGAVALVLARSADAARRGLRRRAEVVGSATNQDGRSAGLTVPNGPAQVAVVRAALAAARVEPAAIDYVEAHGTGTALGDPIELHALGEVFAATRAADRPLTVGSVKTNFGHTEAAAGALSALKVTLQLEHGEIAPHLHFDAPSAHVAWDRLPLAVPTTRRPWPAGDRRHAGVSSFGFSGSNVHVVLRSAPTQPERAAAPADPLLVLTLAAADDDALRGLALACAAALAAAPPTAALDLCYTMAVGRSALPRRAAALAASPAGLAAAARSLAAGSVLGVELDPALGATAQAFVQGRGDRAAVVTHLAAAGGRRGEAPLYPFQRRRYWYDGPAPTPVQLRERLEAAPIRRLSAPTGAIHVAVHGAMDPAVQRELAALGAVAAGGDHAADRVLFAPAAASTPAATAASIQALLALLRAEAGAVRPRPLCVLTSAEPAAAPLALALRAALRAAGAERPGWTLAWVAAADAAAPAAVAQAVLADDGETECEVRGAARFGVRFDAVDAVADPATPIAGTVLVSGGSGALGVAVAADLLARGADRVVLWSRRGVLPPTLVAAGERITAAAVDVGDDAAVAAGLSALRAADRGPTAVVHLAGVADDALLPDLEPERIAAQLQPKLLGTAALGRQLPPGVPLVVVSSAAAWLGNGGQVAYAAANGAAEGVIRARRAAGGVGRAIAFGPLAGGGLAARPGVRERLAAHGIDLLPAARASAALAAALAEGAPEVAVVAFDRGRFAAALGSRRPSRLRSVLPAPPPASPSRAGTGLRGRELATAIAAAVAAVLGRTAAEVPLDAPLLQLGLDSLLAVDLQQRLLLELGIELPLVELLGAADCVALAAAAVPALARTPAGAATGDDLVAYVEQLSDDEVRAMLARGSGDPAAGPGGDDAGAP